MPSSVVNSPNSTFEEDTIRANSSVLGSDGFFFDSAAPRPPAGFHANNYLQPSHHEQYPSQGLHIHLPPETSFNDFSMQNLLLYLIFLNHHAMSLVNLFHNDTLGNSTLAAFPPPMFKLNMDLTPDLLTDYSLAPPPHENMYSVLEFDLGNPLFDSILDLLPHDPHLELADLLLGSIFTYANQPLQPLHQPQPLHHGLHDGLLYPYTPTISDSYTPTVSETLSFTPNSTLDDYSRAVKLLTTPPQPHFASKITKKPSLSRLSNSVSSKKSAYISSHVLGDLPQALGILPLCNKYKGLDIHGLRPAMVPPLNVFRHNLDSSSTSLYYSKTDEPIKRKTYPSLNEVTSNANQKRLMSRKPSKNALQVSIPGDLSPTATYSDGSTPSSTPTTGKPKKHTRRRLLPRSKKGCWICRIKHLKCDEIRPVCTSCYKFGIECDYLVDKPDYILDKALRKEKLDAISLVRKQKQSGVKPRVKREEI